MTTTGQIAQALNKTEYPIRESDCQYIFREAKDAGIVIVYGLSDDLVELRGAIYDESGCYDGGLYRFDVQGFLPINENNSFEYECDRPKTVEDCQKIVERYQQSFAIQVLWKSPTALWTYVLDERITDFATFDITKNDSLYCRGIVFRLPQRTLLAILRKNMIRALYGGSNRAQNL